MLLFRKPDSKPSVVYGDAARGEVVLHRLGDGAVLRAHGFGPVIGQLYKQQWIDGHAEGSVGFGQSVAAVERELHQMLVETLCVFGCAGEVGIEHHLPLYHLGCDDLLAADTHLFVGRFGPGSRGYAYFDLGIYTVKNSRRAVGSL